MRILILGGTGMLGHQLILSLSQAHEVWATIRSKAQEFPLISYTSGVVILEGVDVLHFQSVMQAFAEAKPDAVINCVGLIKQHEAARDNLLAIDLNSRLPHQLALLCAATGSRLIHISTDCVFLGTKGMYLETDALDAPDIYGRTKALGEVTQFPHCLTIRTSIVGRELFGRYGLLEWFLAQRGTVKGYRCAVFSGFSTLALAEILLDCVLPRPDLAGLYHVSAEPINKYELLTFFKRVYEHQVELVPDDKVVIDRSLNSARFRRATGFVPKSWEQMVREMALSPIPYEQWKNNNAAS